MKRLATAAGPSPGLELTFTVLLVWAALGCIPLLRGEISISWDALNHQVYLGWMAERSRLTWDVMAASSQSYQYPYLYWPLYRLAVDGFTGPWAGFLLATLQMGNAPAVWLIARACIPEASWYASGMRVLAVVLGFMSALVLSLIDSTSNDLLAATPLLWAIALSLPAVISRQTPSLTRLSVAAALAGVSIAWKLSNGPLAVFLLPLWAWYGEGWMQRARIAFIGGGVMTASFIVTWAPWGVQLWDVVGNPLYPFLEPVFAAVRAAFGWSPP